MNSEIDTPVNLGNPEEITILELSKIINLINNSNQKTIFLDLPKDDPLIRKPYIKKAIKYLGWLPKTNLKDGIEKTLNWMKTYLSYNQN